ncbi:MAG: hypothetical protein IT182_03855 [Acidobacteria bacterium]|nr:hypothetical protein [Acidobacteriota bacterium]
MDAIDLFGTLWLADRLHRRRVMTVANPVVGQVALGIAVVLGLGLVAAGIVLIVAITSPIWRLAL